MISALHERGHLSHTVTHILRLIDDEAFLRTSLRLVSTTWNRIIVEDDFLWRNVIAKRQRTHPIYDALRKKSLRHCDSGRFEKLDENMIYCPMSERYE